MKGMTLEFDGAGTPVGSTFFVGRARDWARFGELYRLDGVIEGKRILPEGWVKWSATPTVESPEGYAAGFWSNQGDSRGAKARVKEGFPPDSFMAVGALGQRIVIVPSSNLVVVRMGVTQDFSSSDYGVARLVSDVIAAIGNGT
jgi:CubicO group peptidase (beta-lactamase class C family)